MSSESLDAVTAAIQAHVNETHDEPWIVDNAIVGAELVGFAEDGETQRKIVYLIPTDNFSISGGLGLLEATRHYLRRDALDHSARDED